MGIQSKQSAWIPAASSYLRKITPDQSHMSMSDIKDLHFRFEAPHDSCLNGFVQMDGHDYHFCTIRASQRTFLDIRKWLEESGSYSPNGDHHTGVVTIDGPSFNTRITISFAGRIGTAAGSFCNVSRLTIERSDLIRPTVDCICLSNRTRKRFHRSLIRCIAMHRDSFNSRARWNNPHFWSEGGRHKSSAEMILECLTSGILDAIPDDDF